MAKPTCHSCVYAYWDRSLWMRSLASGFPARPFCANHPDSPGRERETPCGEVCRNYRLRPKTPDLADGTVKRIPIAGGLYAYVDAADYPEISRHKWRLVGTGYAGRHEKGKLIFMHREIMKPPKGKVVDHISGHRMDNTRANMHICTPAENNRNRGKHHGTSSQYLGVFYHKPTRKWLASIGIGGKRRNIGRFDDEVEAARAYDRAAVEQSGEFVRLNFPDEWPPERRRQVHAEAQRTAKEHKPAERKKSKSRPARTKTAKRKKPPVSVPRKAVGANHHSPAHRHRAETRGRRAPRRK